MIRSWSFQPEALSSLVEQEYGLDADEFQESVCTRFGQRIDLLQGRKWIDKLAIEHIGCGPVVFPWGRRFCKHPILEWAYRTWSIERVQSRIDLRPCMLVGRLLAKISATPSATVQRLEDALADWAVDTAVSALATRQPQLQIGLRVFLGWGVDENIPGFTEYALNRVMEISLIKHGTTHLVSILDPDEGPFTFTELRSIERCLDEHEGLIEEKAIYYLARDWGLRPVQIALLRTSDVGQDDVGPFVMVPSVKGVRRSALRRHPTNFKKRYVAPETYVALNEAKTLAQSSARMLSKKLIEWSICSAEVVAALPIPLFPAPRTKRRYQVLAADQAIVEYLLHPDAGLISRRVRRLTQTLKVPRQSGNLDGAEDDFLEIGLLRLRRTKGTSMVLNGATPDEVAEALDHETTQTVSHYFKFNRDLIEFIDVVQSANVDVKAAADAWAGRLVSQAGHVEFPKLKIGKLGICSLGKPCPYHPAVTCYSCQKFEPFLDGDHELARSNMIEFKDLISETSTGPVLKQIDMAIHGADAIIKAVGEVRDASA